MRRPWTATAAAGLLALTACGSAQEAAPGTGRFPMTVSDCGRQVVIEEQPQRVLTMASTAAVMMWAAGAADRITARSNEGGVSLGPAEEALRNVPIVSPNQDLSREVIIGQQPDLVLTAGLNMTTVEDLEAAGIDSIVNAGFCDGTGSGANPDGDVDFDDVFADLELYGRIFGTAEAATAKVAELRARVAAVAERFRDAPPRTGAAMILSESELSAYGRPNMTHTQLELLGITDVFGDVETRLAEISIEELIDRNPDVLVLLSGGADSPNVEQTLAGLRSRPGLDQVNAVRNGQLVLLESPFILGSPLAVDGLETMAEMFGGPA